LNKTPVKLGPLRMLIESYSCFSDHILEGEENLWRMSYKDEIGSYIQIIDDISL